jgi:hypothetical protein
MEYTEELVKLSIKRRAKNFFEKTTEGLVVKNFLKTDTVLVL